MTFSGTQAALNAALATVSYQGTVDFAGRRPHDPVDRPDRAGRRRQRRDHGQPGQRRADRHRAGELRGHRAVRAHAARELAVLDIDAGARKRDRDAVGAHRRGLRHAGRAAVTVAGSGTPLVTLTGTVADDQHAPRGGGGTVTYLVTSDSPPATDTLTLTINDGGASGAGGPLSASVASTITIGAQNDAPVNTLPGGSTTLEDTPVVFSAAGGNQISVTDVDAGGAPVQVTLNASNGVDHARRHRRARVHHRRRHRRHEHDVHRHAAGDQRGAERPRLHAEPRLQRPRVHHAHDERPRRERRRRRALRHRPRDDRRPPGQRRAERDRHHRHAERGLDLHLRTRRLRLHRRRLRRRDDRGADRLHRAARPARRCSSAART